MLRKSFGLFIINLSFTASVIFLTACESRAPEGKIIVSIGDRTFKTSDLISEDSWRYSTISQLALIDPMKPDHEPDLITSSFYSACSPSVSYDGSRMLFAAKKEKNDFWQIWEMDLGSKKSKQITYSSQNSTDPAYLPGDRIVFTRRIENDSLKSGSSLFTCRLEGSDLSRITFNPHSYFSPTILNDGRIVAVTRQVFPGNGVPVLMVLRPDGTKCELFYGENHGAELTGGIAETRDGFIYFTESDQNIKGKENLVSIKYNRPLHSKTVVSSTEMTSFNSVADYEEKSLLVTARKGDEKFALYEFDTEKMTLGRKIFADNEYDVLDAVVLRPNTRPKKLPSEVDMGVKTGLLLCQNINLTGLQSPENVFDLKNADRVEIIGVDSSLGVIQVETDGSVYLKIAADTPFRMKTLNKDNDVIDGPGSWLYLRPNERRGCVGCHEDQEIVPANRYSMAVGKEPVLIPVHYSGIKEKQVELE